jgi:hypothetical protein
MGSAQNAPASRSQVRKRRPEGPLRTHQANATRADTRSAAGASAIARPCAAALSKSAGSQPTTTCTSATRKGSTIVSITIARWPAGLVRRRSRPRTARSSASPAKNDPKVRPERNAVSFAQKLRDMAAVVRNRKRRSRVSR